MLIMPPLPAGEAMKTIVGGCLVVYYHHGCQPRQVRSQLERCSQANSFSNAVILRKRSPSLREGLPTKDLCIFPATASPQAFVILTGFTLLALRSFRWDRCRAMQTHVPLARNAQVLRLLWSGFAGQKTALRQPS